MKTFVSETRQATPRVLPLRKSIVQYRNVRRNKDVVKTRSSGGGSKLMEKEKLPKLKMLAMFVQDNQAELIQS